MLSEKPWQPEQVLQLLMRLFASMLLGTLLITALSSAKWLGSGQLKLLTLFIGTLSLHGVAVWLTHRLLREHGTTWQDAFGFITPGLGRALLLAILAAVGVLPIAWSLGQLSAKVMTWLQVQPVVQTPVQMLQMGLSLPTKLFIAILAIVVAPFAEELVFRGLIYTTLKQNGFPRLAFWGTSILFGMIHFNAMFLLPLIFLALVLTLLYETTDNLLAPIFAHSLFNFVNFFCVVVQPAGPAST